MTTLIQNLGPIKIDSQAIFYESQLKELLGKIVSIPTTHILNARYIALSDYLKYSSEIGEQ